MIVVVSMAKVEVAEELLELGVLELRVAAKFGQSEKQSKEKHAVSSISRPALSNAATTAAAAVKI